MAQRWCPWNSLATFFLLTWAKYLVCFQTTLTSTWFDCLNHLLLSQVNPPLDANSDGSTVVSLEFIGYFFFLLTWAKLTTLAMWAHMFSTVLSRLCLLRSRHRLTQAITLTILFQMHLICTSILTLRSVWFRSVSFRSVSFRSVSFWSVSFRSVSFWSVSFRS